MKKLFCLLLITACASSVYATDKQTTLVKNNQKSSNTITFHEDSFEDGEFPEGWLGEYSWQITDEQSSDGKYSLKTDSGHLHWNGTFRQGYLNFDVKSTSNNSVTLGITIFKDNRGQGQFWSAQSGDWQTITVRVLDNASLISIEGRGTTFIDNVRFIAEGQDTDNDGMEDQWELTHGLNYKLESDASLDSDNDGLTNLQEYQQGTLPNYYDSDGDDVNDSQDSEPLNPDKQ